MGQRKNAVTAIAAAEILLAAIMVVVPKTVFPVCESPMHCYESYMAESGLAAVVAVAAVLSIVSKGMETPRLLSGVTAVCGLFVILYPSALIGVCGSPKMPCHYGLLPVWNLIGGVLVVLSLAVFIVAREEKV